MMQTPSPCKGEGRGGGHEQFMTSRFNRTPTITARARTLRRRMSPIEQRLWHALRGGQLGVSFRRQHPRGPYVLDFYCAPLRLAIELDGDEHAGRRRQDTRRTDFLNGHGIHVIRFANRDVWSNLDGVLEVIALELTRLRSVTPTRR